MKIKFLLGQSTPQETAEVLRQWREDDARCAKITQRMPIEMRRHSPPEHELFLAMILEAIGNERPYCISRKGETLIAPNALILAQAEESLYIDWQWKSQCGKVCDFLVERRTRNYGISSLVVECQSATYHKDAIVDDIKARKVVVNDGIHTRHLWATEIFHDPIGCGREVWEMLRVTEREDTELRDLLRKFTFPRPVDPMTVRPLTTSIN